VKVTAAKKCILIRFGDNDFGKTLRAFADVLSAHRDVYAEGFLTKVKIAELWNTLAPGLYAVAQNGGHYNTGTDVASYLRISADSVYLDNEAVDHINDNQGQWNHSWIYIGLDGSPNTLI
jgi:hypothetical protein